MDSKLQQMFGMLTVLALAGCSNFDYRVRSTINTEKPYAMSWDERPPLTAPVRYMDRDLKNYYINPYTFNPADPKVYQPAKAVVGKRGAESATAAGYSLRAENSWMTEFNNWFIAKSNSLTGAVLATNTSETLERGRAQLFEVYAPLYWKASTSSNLTGLSDDDRRYCRNDLQNAMFRVIREATSQHLALLKANDNRLNLLFGAATMGLAGGASVAGGATAKALAASAAGTAGARSLVNEQLYRNTFVEAIIALIQKDQAEFAEMIRTNRQTNSIYNYTVEAAISDAKEYETRGSFYNGLALLQKAVQNQINGGTNAVAINQLASERVEIVTPTSLILDLKSGTEVTNSFALKGRGLTQLDAPGLVGASNSVARVVWAEAHSQSELRLDLVNTATNGVALLELPLRNGTEKLSIKTEIKP